MGGRSFVSGAIAGATVAYLFDPRSGRGRRAKAVDMSRARVRRTAEAFGRKGRYLGGRVEGITQTFNASGDHPRDTDDRTIVDRIRSELDLGDGIVVDAADGVVTLRGEAAEAESRSIERRVRYFPGVQDVRNLLHPAGEPAPNKLEARSVG